MGVHESLEPLLISCYEDEFELLVVETKIDKREDCFITGYGPQETWEEGKKIQFFVSLDQVIVKAQISGKSVYISMDANSKAQNIFLKTIIKCPKMERSLLR